MWSGASFVEPTASVWNSTQLRAECGFWRKKGPYWNVFCCNGRLVRSIHDRVIPYHCFATFRLGMEFFRRSFARMTPYKCRLEVLRGFWVELPPVFSYRMREHCDPGSLWWAAAYTELSSKGGSVYIV